MEIIIIIFMVLCFFTIIMYFDYLDNVNKSKRKTCTHNWKLVSEKEDNIDGKKTKTVLFK